MLENLIIKDVRNLSKERTRSVIDKNGEINEFFFGINEIFELMKKFEMNEITEKYIELYQILLERFKKGEEIKEFFKTKEEILKSYYVKDILGQYYYINEYDNMLVKDKFEELSFNIYLWATGELNKLEKKTKEEIQEINEICETIHGYLKAGFSKTADAIADLKLETRKLLK